MVEIITHLTFVGASTDPTELGDYVIYNQCDGLHLVEASFDTEDGEFLGFRPFAQGVLPRNFYCAWARIDQRLSSMLFESFARMSPP